MDTRKKRARRPRGRGLRTRTGCLTCRKRHKKCDEKQPVCGPCSISSRNCVFARDLDAQSALASLIQAPPPSDSLDENSCNNTTSLSRTDSDNRQVASYSPHIVESQPSHPPQPHHGSPNGLSIQGASPQNVSGSHYVGPWSAESGITNEKWTANFASTRWLDLLANDAAQADGSFSLAPSPEPESRRLPGQNWQAIFTHVSPALLNGQAQLPENLDPEDERKAWQSESDVVLSDYEAVLFRHFADRCARCFDIFDPQRLFSNYAIRLALKNSGLMKAILALAAKHRSMCLGSRPHQTSGQSAPHQDTTVDDGEDNGCIGYYYETLHYIRKALVYSSYTHSEELLATAIVISSYEMLDESDGSGNWQRHLKGVFWIQRSQDVNGDCGGLRQAVWWAWLRQDIWAAFREKRPCLSIWQPTKTLEEMNQHELANRALWILSRAVNYSAEARKMESMAMPDQIAAMQLKQRRKDLLAYIDRWKSLLGDEYTVLPTPKNPGDVFTPLWVHPPEFGVALQAYNFAILLITLHTPHGSGISAFLRMQKQLSGIVETICGIAMELKEESCQILNAQYLFGAGLCVQDKAQREKIISLMEECEAIVGWAPISTWREDLRTEWAKVDGDAGTKQA